MESAKIQYLDIDETFYIENDIVKLKKLLPVEEDSVKYSLDDMWGKV